MASLTPFNLLSDDIVLNIVGRLESDPRDWARISCVSVRLAALFRHVLYPSHCSRALPRAVLADLAGADDPAGGWAALHKLSVCCPGLVRAGVLLEHSDFGLNLDIGPDLQFPASTSSPDPQTQITVPEPAAEVSAWSLFDDLYFDTVYDASESQLPRPPAAETEEPTAAAAASAAAAEKEPARKRRKQWVGPVKAHLASGAWNLSREQGNKLLASRFRGDCLYLSDFPGCVHAEEKRKYMLFRGVFKNFKRSRVWRTINDGNRSRIGIDCAFCPCRETWDLHSAFCLKRVFGFHDDGDPVVRAYVCENGHVSGAWTERPMYT